MSQDDEINESPSDLVPLNCYFPTEDKLKRLGARLASHTMSHSSWLFMLPESPSRKQTQGHLSYHWAKRALCLSVGKEGKMWFKCPDEDFFNKLLVAVDFVSAEKMLSANAVDPQR